MVKGVFKDARMETVLCARCAELTRLEAEALQKKMNEAFPGKAVKDIRKKRVGHGR